MLCSTQENIFGKICIDGSTMILIPFLELFEPVLNDRSIGLLDSRILHDHEPLAVRGYVVMRSEVAIVHSPLPIRNGLT